MTPYTRTISADNYSGFTILPFACVHKGSPNHYAAGWNAFKDRMTEDQHAYALGVGDYFEFARTTYRAAVAHSSPDAGDDNSVGMIDAYARAEAWAFAQELEPFKDRIIGLVEGNHYWTFQTTDAREEQYAGETTTQYICRVLGVPYLGDTTSTRLVLEADEFTDYYDIIANHSHGTGGATASADLGKLERQVEPAFNADLYVTAHTHRRIGYFLPRMQYGADGFREKPHLLVKAGCFYQTYVPHRTGYADKKLLRPVDLGWTEVWIRYRKDGKGWRRSVHFSMTAHEYLQETQVKEVQRELSTTPRFYQPDSYYV